VTRPDGEQRLPAAFTYVDPREYERVLIPITTNEQSVMGGNGSLWASRLALFNGNAEPLNVNHDLFWFDESCQVLCLPTPPVPSRKVYALQRLLFSVPGQMSPPTTLLFIKRPLAESVAFSLRIQDLSRQSLTWGTEIPVVHEREFKTAAIELFEVPLEARFRETLRIYDPDARQQAEVRLRFFRLRYPGGQPDYTEPEIFSVVMPLLVPAGSVGTLSNGRLEGSPDFPLQPGYAQLDLSSIAELQNMGTVRVEVEPVSPALRFWAFVSVTNNDTQHVTTVIPQ